MSKNGFPKNSIKKGDSDVSTTYKLNADELTNDILNSIKSAYQHKEIEIIVQDIQDETEYLLSTEANSWVACWKYLLIEIYGIGGLLCWQS